MSLLEWTFWIAVALVGYVYVGYPMLLALPLRRRDTARMVEGGCPAVTLFVPVRNEERVMRAKLENCLALDYPRDRLEIIIASDGSTDRTADIVREYAARGVVLDEGQEWQGKNRALNRVLPRARGEVVVFSDANAMLQPGALRSLVRHFVDPSVGLVAGHLKYVKASRNSTSRGEALYFVYERVLKRLESRQGAVVTANGALYAVQRALAAPLPPDVPNDFFHSLVVGAQGYRVVFEPHAVAEEQASGSHREEFRRRVRIVSRSIQAVRLWARGGSVWTPQAFYLLSHKVIRWGVPVYLLVALWTSALLPGPAYGAALLGQLSFYGLGALGGLGHNRRILSRICFVPFYFCLINLAALVGTARCLRRRPPVAWESAPSTRAAPGVSYERER